MKSAKEIIFTHLKENLDFEIFSKIWTLYQNMICKEKNYYQAHYVSLRGKQKYFIVRMSSPLMGVGAVIRNFILVASWAEKRGYIPVLDWEYGVTFLNGELGQDNFQGYFFENQMSIANILQGNKVLVGTINHVDAYDKKNKFIYNNIKSGYVRPDGSYKKEYFHNFNFYIKKYFVLKHSLIEECWSLYGSILKNKSETIAVMMREEFSKEGHENEKNTASGKLLERHPMYIGTQEAIELVRKLKKKWNCKYVFVSSMMQETKELFEAEFGKAVRMIERDRITWKELRMQCKELDSFYSAKEKAVYPKEKLIEEYKAYIQEIYIASKCGYLMGGATTGTTLALSLNDGEYIDEYIVEDRNGIQVIVKN